MTLPAPTLNMGVKANINRNTFKWYTLTRTYSKLNEHQKMCYLLPH